ncbi:MAG TPA: hypothetical protein VFZ48_05665 [Candidatus Saccharimonadales bacterium]
MVSKAKQLDGTLKGKLTSIEGAVDKGDVELARRRWNSLGNNQRDRICPHLSQEARSAVDRPALPAKEDKRPTGKKG